MFSTVVFKLLLTTDPTYSWRTPALVTVKFTIHLQNTQILVHTAFYKLPTSYKLQWMASNVSVMDGVMLHRQ